VSAVDSLLVNIFLHQMKSKIRFLIDNFLGHFFFLILIFEMIDNIQFDLIVKKNQNRGFKRFLGYPDTLIFIFPCPFLCGFRLSRNKLHSDFTVIFDSL